jgi:hypothetical protein
MDMLCFMHEGNPYGTLKVGSKVILPSNLAVMVGATLQEIEGWLEELESANVFDRGDDGEIMSRRMIRDEYLRNIRAEGGKKGGNPALKVNPKVGSKVNPEDNQKPTPSSSSSPSSSPLGDEEKIIILPPKFSEVESFAKSQPMTIPQECIEAFFDEMEALQWTYKGFGCVAKTAWQGRFRRYATNWINNANSPNRNFR